MCLFGARRLTDGTLAVDILAVAERWSQAEVEVQTPPDHSRSQKMRIRLPEDALNRSVPIMMREVRIEQI